MSRRVLSNLSLLAAVALGPNSSACQGLIREIAPAFGLPGIGFLGQVGDVDRDGASDLLVTSAGRQYYVVSSRTGVALSPLVSWSTIIDRAIPLGDVNADGLPDVLLVSSQIEVVTGTLAPLYTVPGQAAALAGDRNGDGVLDFFSPDGVRSGRDGSLLLGVALRGSLAAVRDVNGDGRWDVAVSSSAFGGVGVFSGADGTGLFSVAAPVGRAYEAGDVDADGFQDVIISEAGANTVVSVRLRRALSLPGWPTANPAASVGDLNRDGSTDIAFALTSSGLAFEVRSGRDNSVLASAPSGGQIYGAPGSRLLGEVGDANSDGLVDFAISAHNPTTRQGVVQILGPAVGTWQPFGQGCPGPWGVPQLTTLAPPVLGYRFTARVANLQPFTGALLMVGFSNTTWAGLSLPLELAPIGATGCRVYCSGDLLQPAFNLNGVAEWQLAIPRDPGLVRTRFFMQGVSLDAGANAAGIIVSNAGEGRLGA